MSKIKEDFHDKSMKDQYKGEIDLVKEIIEPMTMDEMKKCNGYQMSSCCGGFISEEMPFCHICKDHASNWCYDCVAKNECPNSNPIC